MAVDAYLLAGDDVALPPAPEQVCLPIDAPGHLTGGEPLTVPTPRVARVPAGSSTGTNVNDLRVLVLEEE